MTSLEKGLRDFAQFAAKLKGDEKSEAQTFLFHLLASFGHDANTLPEGSTFEYRVRFPGQRTQFADFVWPGRVLIEMKSHGVKLSKHYQQTFDYCYGMKDAEDILAFLLNLNQECADKESKGRSITAPGLPGFISNRKDITTDDCIMPPS